MKLQREPMERKMVARCFSALVAGGACLVFGAAVSTAFAEPGVASFLPAKVTSIKGTCDFGGTESTWSATLTPKGNGTYDAVYVSSWGGSPLNYVGTIKTDLKKNIRGKGASSGGRANGTFEFSGKYGTNGIAQCTYEEVGGGRKGTMTAEMPK